MAARSAGEVMVLSVGTHSRPRQPGVSRLRRLLHAGGRICGKCMLPDIELALMRMQCPPPPPPHIVFRWVGLWP